MPLHLIVCPTIHVVVEDADKLTDELRDRITAWLTLPAYEPNPNGDSIRAEHIHGGSEFVAVSEDMIESIESKPFNYETGAFLAPLETA